VKLCWLLSVIGICCLPLHSASAASREAEVKAAYLFKLTSFVRWPPAAFRNPTEPLQICISGRADIYAVLAALARNKQADGHPIAVVQLGPQSAALVHSCHTLFVGRNDAASRALLAAATGTPVLTITDLRGGTRGGVVEFVQRDGFVRLLVRRHEAEARQLELSSKLLAVAEVMEK
jgi:hypothetical protein